MKHANPFWVCDDSFGGVGTNPKTAVIANDGSLRWGCAEIMPVYSTAIEYASTRTYVAAHKERRMSNRRGRGRPSESDTDTSAAIAGAALHRFAAGGFEATSLREIAQEAGVDVALISYRFGGKLGLWKAIVSQAAGDLRRALDLVLRESAAASAQDQLAHSARAFLAYLLDRPEVPRLLLRDITIDTDRSQWLLETLSLPLHRHFIELAQAAAQERSAAPRHLQLRMANFIYSAASTVARRERLSRLIGGIGDDAEFAAALEHTLVEGVLLP